MSLFRVELSRWNFPCGICFLDGTSLLSFFWLDYSRWNFLGGSPQETLPNGNFLGGISLAFLCLHQEITGKTLLTRNFSSFFFSTTFMGGISRVEVSCLPGFTVACPWWSFSAWKLCVFSSLAASRRWSFWVEVPYLSQLWVELGGIYWLDQSLLSSVVNWNSLGGILWVEVACFRLFCRKISWA